MKTDPSDCRTALGSLPCALVSCDLHDFLHGLAALHGRYGVAVIASIHAAWHPCRTVTRTFLSSMLYNFPYDSIEHTHSTFLRILGILLVGYFGGAGGNRTIRFIEKTQVIHSTFGQKLQKCQNRRSEVHGGYTEPSLVGVVCRWFAWCDVDRQARWARNHHHTFYAELRCFLRISRCVRAVQLEQRSQCRNAWMPCYNFALVLKLPVFLREDRFCRLECWF